MTLWQFEYANIDSIGFEVSLRKVLAYVFRPFNLKPMPDKNKPYHPHPLSSWGSWTQLLCCSLHCRLSTLLLHTWNKKTIKRMIKTNLKSLSCKTIIIRLPDSTWFSYRLERNLSCTPHTSGGGYIQHSKQYRDIWWIVASREPRVYHDIDYVMMTTLTLTQ